jgi:hypothetical protein
MMTGVIAAFPSLLTLANAHPMGEKFEAFVKCHGLYGAVDGRAATQGRQLTFARSIREALFAHAQSDYNTLL